MGIWLIKVMGISLGLTILLEELFAVVIGIRNKRDLLLIFLVNLLTNPAVVFTYYAVDFNSDINMTLTATVLEIAAILTEARYFKSYGNKIKHPYLFTAGINIFSYGAGKVINLL